MHGGTSAWWHWWHNMVLQPAEQACNAAALAPTRKALHMCTRTHFAPCMGHSLFSLTLRLGLRIYGTRA